MAYIHTYIHTYIQTDRQTDRQTDELVLVWQSGGKEEGYEVLNKMRKKFRLLIIRQTNTSVILPDQLVYLRTK